MVVNWYRFCMTKHVMPWGSGLNHYQSYLVCLSFVFVMDNQTSTKELFYPFATKGNPTFWTEIIYKMATESWDCPTFTVSIVATDGKPILSWNVLIQDCPNAQKILDPMSLILGPLALSNLLRAYPSTFIVESRLHWSYFCIACMSNFRKLIEVV